MDELVRIRRIDQVEGVLYLLGLSMLISCTARETFRGHAYEGSLRRGLADSAREIFDVTKYGAVANDDQKDNVQVSYN
ncbi:hypothetical protein TorRG33x02_268250 [Trema orientale]|uniref:Uncharacterized protein n=2 Tax=Cannabaceae TaxID=3481 RepID=A0A2P5CXS6_PARAD|nr:hypothetical protein PanWU01x14_113420 [Parasponia andersonii]PON66312.1 hypothetical protein TorRG33x02_268250 [Trema orientale]